MGDQLVTYDKYDGLQSAMIGILNSGLSGFTLGHSDIGGYTSIDDKMFGLGLKYVRDKELLHRWIEMSTFSDVIMRSHPSNLPEKDYQIWDEVETIQFLKQFTEIHVKLADYKKQLMTEAEQKGKPVTRPLLLHWPNLEEARKTDSQFMLGENILVAPIFKEKAKKRSIFLPGPEQWINLWSKTSYDVLEGGEVFKEFDCILGQPCVFLRSTNGFDALEMAKYLAPGVLPPQATIESTSLET